VAPNSSANFKEIKDIIARVISSNLEFLMAKFSLKLRTTTEKTQRKNLNASIL